MSGSVCFSQRWRKDNCEWLAYYNFLPLADISDKSREAKETEEGEELGEAQHAQRAGGVQQVCVLLRVLAKRTHVSTTQMPIEFVYKEP